MDTSEVRQNHKFNEQSLKEYMIKNINLTNSSESLFIRQFNFGQSNPSFYIKYQNNEYVLRKKPHGQILKGAHQVDREFQIQKVLFSQGFPVPEPIIFCKDTNVIGTEFYLMRYVKGRIFRDISLPGISPEERREIYQSMIETLARLHQIDPLKVNLQSYGKNTPDYSDRQIVTWTKQYKDSETENVPFMNQCIEQLPKNVPKSAQNHQISIIHGDYRLDNIIFHATENRVLAVLDWELSTLGDKAADLAYNCLPYYANQFLNFQGLKGLDFSYYGIPSAEQVKQKYVSLIPNSSEIQDKEWHFYVSLSWFRLAGISQGVYKRSLQGNASNTQAGQYIGYTRYLSGLSYQALQKSINGDIREVPYLYKDYSQKFQQLYQKLLLFMDKYVYTNERLYEDQIEKGEKRWKVIPPILAEVQKKAREQNLWNLFMPSVSGLSNKEYAPLCEIMGRSSHFGPSCFNCAAPDTGNMEVLHQYGTQAQKDKWLKPLLNFEIRSCYAMTEPMVASSDATNISTTIIKNGEFYEINGRKWWTSGGGDPHCKLIILMGISPNKNKPRHQQHSMILVPFDAPGVKVLRPLTVFGMDDAPHGHVEIIFNNVQVPLDNILVGEGMGFAIAQGRLGPGRIHHCMRLIGVAERAYDNMVDRTLRRKIFGKKMYQNESVQKKIAKSRLEIDQARLLVTNAAKMVDDVGAKKAQNEIAMIKIVAPNVALKVIDRAIQIYGGAGVCQDTFLASAYSGSRTLRIADGPDEVHLRTIANNELRKVLPRL